MKKLVRRTGICFLAAVLFWCGTLLSDRQRLKEQLIRLHVVANSDSREDQDLKLQIRDAVTRSLQQDLKRIADAKQARAYLQERLPQLKQLAEQTLLLAGCTDPVQVTLCEEAFDTRQYETFSLPAGIYQGLRIVIGDGEGKNWWCVVYPALCIPQTMEDLYTAAAATGMPASLTHALTGNREIRFACLDLLGKLENIFFAG